MRIIGSLLVEFLCGHGSFLNLDRIFVKAKSFGVYVLDCVFQSDEYILFCRVETDYNSTEGALCFRTLKV